MQVLHYTELDPKERADPMAVVFPKVKRRGKNMMVVKSAQKNMTLDVDVSRLTVGAKIYFILFTRYTVLEDIFLQLCKISVFRCRSVLSASTVSLAQLRSTMLSVFCR